MRPTRELAEHLGCVVRVGRLAVDPPVEDDRRVDAERDPPVGVHRARLALGVPEHELDRVGVGRVVLDVVGATTSKGIRELLEDRRRRCGEVEASVSVSCARPRSPPSASSEPTRP